MIYDQEEKLTNEELMSKIEGKLLLSEWTLIIQSEMKYIAYFTNRIGTMGWWVQEGMAVIMTDNAGIGK